MDVSSPVSVTSMPHATPQSEQDAKQKSSVVPYLLLSAVDSAERNTPNKSMSALPLPPPPPLTGPTSRRYSTRTESLPQQARLSSSCPDSRRKIFTDYWDRAERGTTRRYTTSTYRIGFSGVRTEQFYLVATESESSSERGHSVLFSRTHLPMRSQETPRVVGKCGHSIR